MITYSAFDSDLFGRRIGWAEDLASADDRQARVFDLVFLRGGYPCLLHPRARLLDVRYDLAAVPAPGTAAMPRASNTEAVAAAALARAAFAEHSRYFHDPALRDKAPAVYARWIENAHARGDLYALDGHGFIAASEHESALRIDLIAVAPAWRGHGLGGQLLRGFLGLPDERERRVKVEAANLSALHLYLAAGFRIAAVESVQHVWLSDP